MDWADYLEKGYLLHEDFVELEDDVELYLEMLENIDTTLACPMFEDCPYVDTCTVYHGDVNATCHLMGGE